MRSSPLLLLTAVACAPPPLPEAPDSRTLTCEPLELEPGQVRAKAIGCSDELPRNSEGRTGDVLLQNAFLSVIIRSPGEALTLVGAPGGTIVDAAPVGWNDRLLEAVPVVDGTWMFTRSWSWGVDSEGAWLTLEGGAATVLGLNEPASVDRVDEGAERRLTYRLRPDSHVLELEGADGLYLHGALGTELAQAGVFHTGIGYLTDGTGVEDLGGAAIFAHADRLAVGTLADVVGALEPEAPRASGRCAGERVRVEDAQGRALAWLDADFDSPMPLGAAALVCLAEGHADGAATPLGEDLSLSPGPAGALWVRVTDDSGAAIPAVVEVDGLPYALPPGGAALPTGPGTKALRIHHGPAYGEWTGTLSVPEGAVTPLSLSLDRAIEAEGWVLVDLFREASPSRTARAVASDDLDLAAAAGVGFALQTALDEVARPFHSDWSGDWLRYRAGSRAETVSAGAVWSWPWGSNTRYAGHGATDWIELSPELVLVGAMGDSSPRRFTVVDADWIQEAGPPGGWGATPTLLRVRGPSDLDTVRALLDAGARVGLVGPVTWSPVPGGEALASAVAVERGLVRGDSVASAGPLLELSRVSAPEDSGGDSAVEPADAPVDLSLRLQARGDARVDAVEVYVDGQLVASFTPTRGETLSLEAELTELRGRWALAVAWGEDWAYSAPLWLD
ncbi:MAG: hypothetical protein H6741_05465 [Alphaproteobacteria bacterium]|nr:hypothetical protein [Alphaproteobacteria bacterium]MCB9792155.1 hypothetical protein [Alphaproteobacteria bacterium]